MKHYFGVVENRVDDPLKLGRCKVRVFGLHPGDKIELPTEDLPWATILQSNTSAAMSGIGSSPTGFVEGTTVIVMYMETDTHKQMPIILGAVAGVPSPHEDQTVQIVETSESLSLSNPDNSTAVDAVNASGEAAAKPAPVIKKPSSSLVASADCFNAIKDEEKLSSVEQGKNKFLSSNAAAKLSPDTPLFPYKDSVGVWTIGWGSTYLLDGSRVNENTRITKAEADTLLETKVNKEFAPGILRGLTAPVTQSMFDALVSMAYNSGVGGVRSSALFASVNATEYETASNQITVFKTNGGSLSGRRAREQKLFNKDGFPKKDMSGVDAAPVTPETNTPDATQNPVVEVKPELAPEQVTTRKVEGFRDPNGVYPTIVNEPDTHRLARHEKIDQTVVFIKEAARAKGIKTGGGTTWDQAPIPYNATYPFNHVRVTESGHVQEFDDTKGNERIHTYHRSGTFTEVDKNGTRVNRIVGDDFEIIERNGHVLVRGTMNLTVMGNSNIRVENNTNIDVLGDVTMTVGGKMTTGVNGDYRIACAGEFSIDAVRIDLNSGKNGSVKMPTETAPGVPDFPTPEVPTRHDETVAQYETPEDGDATAFTQALSDSGAADATPAGDKTPTKETEKSKPDPVVDEKKPEPVSKDCSMIPNTGPIDPSFQLSPNFKLSQLHETVQRLNSPPAVNLTKAEIVCNLKGLCENVLEPIKKLYPGMGFSSVYRIDVPPGGAKNSDHLYGCAADIKINGFTRPQMYEAVQQIVKVVPAWTQIILEYRGASTWIHVAYNPSKGLRMEKFTMNNDKRIGNMGEFILIA